MAHREFDKINTVRNAAFEEMMNNDGEIDLTKLKTKYVNTEYNSQLSKLKKELAGATNRNDYNLTLRVTSPFWKNWNFYDFRDFCLDKNKVCRIIDKPKTKPTTPGNRQPIAVIKFDKEKATAQILEKLDIIIERLSNIHEEQKVLNALWQS